MRRIILDIPEKVWWLDLRAYDDCGDEVAHTPMIDTRNCDLITLDDGCRWYYDRMGRGDEECGST